MIISLLKQQHLDLEEGSLVIDAFGEEILLDENKLLIVEQVVNNLYCFDSIIAQNPNVMNSSIFVKELRRELNNFLSLLPNDIGGIQFFNEQIIRNPHKKIYWLAKPQFYLE